MTFNEILQTLFEEIAMKIVIIVIFIKKIASLLRFKQNIIRIINSKQNKPILLFIRSVINLGWLVNMINNLQLYVYTTVSNKYNVM